MVLFQYSNCGGYEAFMRSKVKIYLYMDLKQGFVSMMREKHPTKHRLMINSLDAHQRQRPFQVEQKEF